MELPLLPCSFDDFPRYLEKATSQEEVLEAVKPFRNYESKLRQLFAQETDHNAVHETHLVPIYKDGSSQIQIRARNLQDESPELQAKYLLPLSADQRRGNATAAITPNLKGFKRNFNIFSESALSDLDWTNVVAAGSSVITALLPVDGSSAESKRALRTHYHEVLAPASDVDLFLYGLNEEQAIQKIKQIEAKVRDSILSETTVVRTKNAVTIVSEYPVRHIQIVLRLYKSVSEILTGFDVDCACVAYDGNEVWAAPRALASFATQINQIDLTRRSPSYENRLSKYSHRGFEVFWPDLDRSRVDPTIYERAFNRVQGLARLLVLEKLPHPRDRDEYLNKRRVEKGRPELPWNARFHTQLPGNVKDAQPDDVAEWIEDDSISSYHTFSIPWGPRYTPKAIERLLFQQDLLKNAEFNRPKDREANLHRHPAFFGRVQDVINDCCGYCPKPETDADLAVLEEESKIYVSGNISFLQDDPGRQEIGSFHPLTGDDWTEMAYIGQSEALCQAIVNNDLQAVIDCFNAAESSTNVNERDHTGRTPLQLAVISSSSEIVGYLIDRGARMVSRLYNGMTALHLAAWKGRSDVVGLLLDRSAQNELEENDKEEKRKQARRDAAGLSTKVSVDASMELDEKSAASEHDSDIEDLVDDASNSDSDEDRMTGSFVQVELASEVGIENENEDDPDVFDVDVIAWDSPCSPLHLAIIAGYPEVIRLLVDKYSADVMLPVKLMTNDMPRRPSGAILSLLLPIDLRARLAEEIESVLLLRGASPSQASMDQRTALDQIVSLAKMELLNASVKFKPEAVAQTINHLVVDSQYWSLKIHYPLLSAIKSGSVDMVHEVLRLGAKPIIELDPFIRAYNANDRHRYEDADHQQKVYQTKVTQPILEAARQDNMVDVIIQLLNQGADVNTLTERSWEFVHEPDRSYNAEDKSLLDVIRDKRQELGKKISEADNKQAALKQVAALDTDQHYLQNYGEGTYQQWSATKDLETAKYIQQERNKYFAYEFKKQAEVQMSSKEKDNLQYLARKYKAVENRLVEEGAKTFYELYPKLKDSKTQFETSRSNGDKDASDTENIYQTRFSFTRSNVTPSETERYIQLFEAAFHGSIDDVKQMCLSSDGKQRPLEISASDHNGFNPFSISLMRGHFDLTSTILDIAAAQYRGDSDGSKRREYSTRPFFNDDSDNSDDDSVTSDDKPRFYQRLVDDKFTIDDIGLLSKDVKSRTSPIQLINPSNYQTWRFMPEHRSEALKRCRIRQTFVPSPYAWNSGRDESWQKFKACWDGETYRTRNSLIDFAVLTNNVRMLKFLLRGEIQYCGRDRDEVLIGLADRQEELKLAFNLGNLDIFDTFIRERGTLLPLQHLAEKSGVAIEEKPKFYQGLSVYGKKRKDWANPESSPINSTETGSPLLVAIMQGNLDVVDYLMSKTPLRRYDEFCSHFSKDQRVKTLAESKGGLSVTLNSWMQTRVHLVLHVAVMSWPAGANKMLRHLLSKDPQDHLEVRTSDGDTPLHLALKVRNLPAFELLLSVGANQRTRDKRGRNLLHTIYEMAEAKKEAVFKKQISLLDQSIIPTLLTERCSNGDPGLQTPLALHLSSTSYGRDGFPLLDAMLELSSGQDLGILDGAGDFPLHVEVRDNKPDRATYLAKKRPDILTLENATGRTPIEVAETFYLQSRMTVPGDSGRNQSYDAQDGFYISKDGDSEAGSGLEDNLPRGDVLYSKLARIAAANPQPRHLIGLLDANETARRLAGRESRNNAEFRRRQAQGLKASNWNRYYSRNQENDSQARDASTNGSKQDEVVQWFGQARGRYWQVPFCHHDSSDLEAELQKWRDFAEGKTRVIQCCEHAASDNRYVRQDHKRMTDAINGPANV